MKQIEVTISPQGETRLETKGFHGNSCQEASRFLKQTLGQLLLERLTSDFYSSAAQSQTSALDAPEQ